MLTFLGQNSYVFPSHYISVKGFLAFQFLWGFRKLYLDVFGWGPWGRHQRGQAQTHEAKRKRNLVISELDCRDRKYCMELNRTGRRTWRGHVSVWDGKGRRLGDAPRVESRVVLSEGESRRTKRGAQGTVTWSLPGGWGSRPLEAWQTSLTGRHTTWLTHLSVTGTVWNCQVTSRLGCLPIHAVHFQGP